MTEMGATFTGCTPPPAPGAEPCERCATPLVLINLMEILRAVAGLNATTGGETRWMEIRRTHPAQYTETLQLREHSPHRCTAARAGTPEPWDELEPLDDDYDREG